MEAVRLRIIKTGSRWGIARSGNGNSFMLSPGVCDPLCGWDWLLDREHPLEECRIEINAWGCRFSATVNPDAHKGKIVQEISRVALSARV
jgi:hypothetical protein